MSDEYEKISPLRRRMLEDMEVRGLAEKTKKDYIRNVKDFAGFLRRSPDTATAEDLREYMLHMRRTGISTPTFNNRIGALRFFFSVTCGRADLKHSMRLRRDPEKLPEILSPEEVSLILECAPGPGLKYKAALSLAYGAGLRGGEVVNLRPEDIERMSRHEPCAMWSVRSTCLASGSRGSPVDRTSPCQRRNWRSRISSAIMGLRFAVTTPGI